MLDTWNEAVWMQLRVLQQEGQVGDKQDLKGLSLSPSQLLQPLLLHTGVKPQS